MKLFAVLLCFGAAVFAQPNCSSSSVRCVGPGRQYRTIQAAADAAVAGDTVYVFDGTYAGFRLGSSHVSGTATSPITFKAQSPAVVINSPGDDIGDGIVVNLVDYVVIDGFTINGAGRAGVNVVESTGSVIKNNSINNSNNWGILTGFAYQVQILNNVIIGVTAQHGIYVSNSNQPYDGPVIMGNTISNTGANGIQLNGDCQTLDHTGHSDGVINGFRIDSNIIRNAKAHSVMLIDSSNGIVRNNVFYSPFADAVQTGTQTTCNFGSNNDVFVNNSIDAPAHNGFRIVQPLSGAVIFNNAIVTDDRRGCVDDANGQQCLADGTDGIYFSPGNRLIPTAQAAAGVFNNYGGHDYSLTAGSPLIDTAAAQYLSVNAPALDILGNSRPFGAGYDYGAYEYGSSPAKPDTTPPTTPGTPSYTATATSVSLSAGASTDNQEVMGYYIYRNGALYAVSLTPNYTDTNVAPGNTYTYAMAAFDSSGNVSPVTPNVTVVMPGIAGCLNSKTTWQARIIPTQPGSFTFEADVTPFGTLATQNGVVGVGPVPPTDYSSLAAIVSFTSSGILARNGPAYSADNAMSWTSGTAYHVRMTINVKAHTYSIFITPSGGTEQMLGANYAFRSEQASANALNYVGVLNEVGVDAVCASSLNGTLLESMLLVYTTTSSGVTGTALVNPQTGALVLPSTTASPAVVASPRTKP